MTSVNWSKTFQNWSKVGVELEKHLLSSPFRKLSSYITIYRLKMFCETAPEGILVGTIAALWARILCKTLGLPGGMFKLGID